MQAALCGAACFAVRRIVSKLLNFQRSLQKPLDSWERRGIIDLALGNIEC